MNERWMASRMAAASFDAFLERAVRELTLRVNEGGCMQIPDTLDTLPATTERAEPISLLRRAAMSLPGHRASQNAIGRN